MLTCLRRVAVLLALMLSPAFEAAIAGPDRDQLGNWFNDPFFQIRSGFPDCPEPLGPRITHEQMRQQEHYRVERGTSCYLSGECKKPNAYAYDADIGHSILDLGADNPTLLEHSTLWITVGRRFVYLEGCSTEHDSLARFETLLRAVPDVQTVLTNIAEDPALHVPYQIFPRPADSR